MNSLIITLCILITAETEILLATDSSTIIPPEYRESPFPSSGLTREKGGFVYEVPAVTLKPLYNYNYDTDTGIKAQENGLLKNVHTNPEVLEARGSYSYTDNESNTFQVSYIANENGFQPKGAHLPTVPPLIKKALQYIAEHSERNGKE